MSDSSYQTKTCEDCGNDVTEVCGDGYCRECHVSLSFDDCVSGEWVRRRSDSILSRGVIR